MTWTQVCAGNVLQTKNFDMAPAINSQIFHRLVHCLAVKPFGLCCQIPLAKSSGLRDEISIYNIKSVHKTVSTITQFGVLQCDDSRWHLLIYSINP